MSHQTYLAFGDGYAIAHDDDKPSPESKAAIEAVMRAAYEMMKEKPDVELYTGENEKALHSALTTVINSEYVGNECESANYHSLTDFLSEIRDGLHPCQFVRESMRYDDGSREWECSHPGCYQSKFVEADHD